MTRTTNTNDSHSDTTHGSSLSHSLSYPLSLEYFLPVLVLELGHFENGLEEMEQVPVQGSSENMEESSNVIEIQPLVRSSVPSMSSAASMLGASQSAPSMSNQLDNEINLIPEQLSAIQAAEFRRSAYNRRRRQPENWKVCLPYTVHKETKVSLFPLGARFPALILAMEI